MIISYKIRLFIISCILFMMSAAVVNTVTAADNDEKSFEVISELGFLSDDFDKENDMELNITKAQFAQMLIKAVLPEFDVADTYEFTDVDAGHENYRYIIAAYQKGIISGDNDGNINPDSDISGIQAVKMLLCAMGYQHLADVQGGYPEGYIKTAAEQLSLNISAISKEYITNCDAIKMLYDVLEDPLMIPNGVKNNNIVYSYGEKSANSILSINNIIRLTGKMTGVPYAVAVRGESIPEAYHVNVGGNIYRITDATYYDYFCMECDVYYRDEDYTALCIVPNSKNDITVINARDIDKFASGKLCYWDEEKYKTISMGSSPNMVYNGMGVPFDTKYLDIKHGLVTVIKNESTNEKTIIVRDVVSSVVSGSNAEGDILLKYPVYDSYKISRNDIAYMENDGIQMDVSGVHTGQLISAEKSINGEILRLTLSDNIIEGTVQAVQGDVITVDGEKYYCQADNLNIKSGRSYKFYLDFIGEICFVEHAAVTDDYAYLLNAWIETDSERVIIKLMNSEGIIAEYETRKKISLNNNTYDTGLETYRAEFLNVLKSTKLDCVSNAKYEQLIKYSTTADGLIKSITTSSDASGDLILSAEYDNRCYRHENECFGDFFINSETLIFYVPDNAVKESVKTLSVDKGICFGKEENVYCMAYDSNDTMLAPVMICFSGNSSISEIDAVSVLFESVSEAVNDDNEVVSVINVYESGKLKSYMVDATYADDGNNIDLTTLTAGDIIWINASGDYCTGAGEILKFNDRDNPPADYQRREGAYSNSSYKPGYYQMAQRREVFGKITAVDNDRMIVCADMESGKITALYRPSSFGNIMLVDFSKTGKRMITTLSPEHLGGYIAEANDKIRVYVHTRYGVASAMFVYVFN